MKKKVKKTKNKVISNSRTRVCQKRMKKYNYSIIYGCCVCVCIYIYIYAIYTQCALGLKRVWYPLRKAVFQWVKATMAVLQWVKATMVTVKEGVFLHWVKATMVSVKEGGFSLG